MEKIETQSLHFQVQSDEGKHEKSDDNLISKGKKHIKRNIYRWHRTIGLIVLIPVVFWTLSGLTHPLMSHWFRPKIANEVFIKPLIDKAKLKLSLQEVLQKNNVSTIENIRIVALNNNQYYQVKNQEGKLLYFNTETGTVLKNGDIEYAQYLARYFIDDTKSEIKSAGYVTEFTDEYKNVNRLLPVYNVAFNRPDKMDIYVETVTSRLGTFSDTKRKNFIWLFSTFHNWGFIGFNETLRIIVLILFTSIVFISALSGIIIYGLMWKKFKKPRNNKDKVGILKRYHRQIGIAVSLTTLTFSFSGGYHVYRKFYPDEREKYVYNPKFNPSKENFASFALLPMDNIFDISLAKIQDSTYYQIHQRENDQIKIIYTNVLTSKELPDGEKQYAKYLAQVFKKQKELLCAQESKDEAGECCTIMSAKKYEASISSVETISKFEGEYGFVNKKLPVVKVSYKDEDNTATYIETTTASLAAEVTDADRIEGFSFAFLHKYHLLDPLGKNFRDGVMALAAFGNLVVALFGIVLFFKVK